jgi:hypothetical protein
MKRKSGDLVSHITDNYDKKDLFFMITPVEGDILTSYRDYLKYYYPDKNLSGLVTSTYGQYLESAIDNMKERIDLYQDMLHRVYEDTKEDRERQSIENKKKRNYQSVGNVEITDFENSGSISIGSSSTVKNCAEPPVKKQRLNTKIPEDYRYAP